MKAWINISSSASDCCQAHFVPEQGLWSSKDSVELKIKPVFYLMERERFSVEDGDNAAFTQRCMGGFRFAQIQMAEQSYSVLLGMVWREGSLAAVGHVNGSDTGN